MSGEELLPAIEELALAMEATSRAADRAALLFAKHCAHEGAQVPHEGITRMAITCAHMREVMRQVGAMQILSVLGEVERGRGEKL